MANGNSNQRRPVIVKDDEGKPLANAADIATFFRSAANALLADDGREIEAEDEQIVAAVRRAFEGDDTAQFNARMDAVMSLASTKDEPLSSLMGPPSAGEKAGHSVEAMKVGHWFRKETVEFISDTVVKKQDYEGAPIYMGAMFEADMLANMGNDRAAVLQRVLIMPRPGSRRDTDNAGDNSPTDYYERTVESGETVKGSYFADMWDATAKGAAILDELTLIKNASEDAKDKMARRQYLSKFRTDATNRIRRTFRWLQQKYRLEKEFPNVLWQFANDKGYPERQDKTAVPAEVLKEATRLPKPFILFANAIGARPSDPVSLTTFNAFNLDKAQNPEQKAGILPSTVAAIMDTVKRGPKQTGTENQSGDKTKAVPTADQVESFLGALGNFFDERADRDAYLRNKAKLSSFYADNRNASARNDLGDLLTELNDFYKPFMPAYEADKETARLAVEEASRLEAERKRNARQGKAA